MLRTVILIAVIAVSVCPVSGWGQGQIPMDKPECATWDSLYNRYLISLNIDNDIVQVDQNGVVTMFRENVGTYITSAGIGGSTFYQSDLTRISGYDLASGDRVFYVDLPFATYIAGAVADTSGNIYVPDIPSNGGPLGTPDMIWKIRLSDGAVSELITTDDGLGFKPRDMAFDPVQNRLIVTFMKEPVYIQAISLTDLTVTNLVRFETDYTNGLCRDQFGNTYVAGYDNGTIYRYDSNLTYPPEVVSAGHNSPCNIDYNPQDHILAVPCYWGDVLKFLPMGRPKLVKPIFSDVGGGDGDGILEGGETIELVATLTNTHFLPLSDISINLIAATGGLTTTQGSADIGSAPSRSEVSNSGSPFLFDIPPKTENQMDSFYLEMTYTSDYGTEVDTLIIEKAIGEVSILLVDDGLGFVEVDQYYRDVLALADSTYDIWHTDIDGPPDGMFLSRFDVVIWFTGDHRSLLLDANEIAAIKNYLDAGGNLLLTGQGIASQLDTVDQDFLHNYLRTELVGISYWPFMVADTGGQVFNPSVSIKVEGSGGASNQTVSDHVGPVNDGVAELKFSGQSDWSAVSYTGTYRMIFLTFGFEAIINNNPNGTDRDLVLPEILDFFDWTNPFFCCIDQAGNVDNDPENLVDLGDLTRLIDYLFISFAEPACLSEANTDGDLEGLVDLGDLTKLIDYLFISFMPLAECP